MRRQPAPAEDVEGGVANGPRRGGAGRHGSVYTRSPPGVPRGSCDDRAVTDPADLGVWTRPRTRARGSSRSRELVATPASRASASATARTATTAIPASVNAWVRVYEEDALRRRRPGRRAARARATRRALCGIPIGLKDLYAVAGQAADRLEPRARRGARARLRRLGAARRRGHGAARPPAHARVRGRRHDRPGRQPVGARPLGRRLERRLGGGARRRAWCRPRPARTPPARCASRRRCAARRRSSRRAALVSMRGIVPLCPTLRPRRADGADGARLRAAARGDGGRRAAGRAPAAAALRRLAADRRPRPGRRRRASSARSRRSTPSASSRRLRRRALDLGLGVLRPLLRRDARLPPPLRRPPRPLPAVDPRLPRARASSAR